jgi:two-component system, sensor histidine kinase YesM
MDFKLLNKNFIRNKLLFRFSIRYKLLFYFLFLIVLPTIIISVTVYYKSQSIISNRVYTTTQNNLAMIDSTFKQKLDTINDEMSLIYFSPELQSIFSSPFFITQSQTILSPQYSYKRINLINEMSLLDKILDSYSVFNTANASLYFKLYIFDRPEYLSFNSSENVTDLGEIQNEEWYPRIQSESRYYVVGLNKVSTPSGITTTLRIAKRLFGLKNKEIPFAGVLTVDVGIDNFNNILRNYKSSPGSTIYLINQESQIVSSSDNSKIGSPLKAEICKAIDISKLNTNPKQYVISRENGTNLIISCRKLVNPNFLIVSTSPVNEMYGELVSFNKVMVIVLVICLALSFAVAMFLSNSISNPIRRLVKSMSVVKDGNFDVNLNYKRNDEFTFLISAYKKMMGQIKDLIDKLYVSELYKKEAELKSLQSQINPHFLYNTLDSINWLALKYDVPDISTMVTSLSDFFRYSLSKGHNIIPLRDEKKQVESYLEIQKIRFKEKLDYIIDFPPEIMECLTVKLILQPIVENAILHGIEKRRGKGTITITASVNESVIELEISDDGIGADIDELNGLLSTKVDSSKSYGIRNVNERIIRTFGNQYGLIFYGKNPTGVTVKIKFPAIRSLEELDVKNDNS